MRASGGSPRTLRARRAGQAAPCGSGPHSTGNAGRMQSALSRVSPQRCLGKTNTPSCEPPVRAPPCEHPHVSTPVSSPMRAPPCESAASLHELCARNS